MEFEEIEIRKRIEEAKKMKYCAKQQMAEAEIQIGEYDLQLLELNKEKEVEIDADTPVTYRQYSPAIVKQAPFMIGVDKETQRIKTEKSLLDTTIWDLFKLEKLIPQVDKYPSTNDIAKKMGWTNTKTAYTCCSIEYGFADEIMNEYRVVPFDEIPIRVGGVKY